jgi:hypothetical protein
MHLAAQLLSRTAVRVIMYVRAYACILCMYVHMRVYYVCTCICVYTIGEASFCSSTAQPLSRTAVSTASLKKQPEFITLWGNYILYILYHTNTALVGEDAPAAGAARGLKNAGI